MSIDRKSERHFISNLTFILFIITNIKNMRIKCPHVLCSRCTEICGERFPVYTHA